MAEPWSIQEAKAQVLAESLRLRTEALVEHVATLVVQVDVNDRDWLSRAACTGLTDASEVFFPTKTRHKGIWERAEAICSACPVNLSCLAAWLHERTPREDKWGYGGCTTHADRAEIRRAMVRLGLRPERQCKQCGAALNGSNQRRYCSAACKTAAYRNRGAA